MNLNEMGGYTQNQKNTIYREMLQPLKLKISQILLYDTETAIEFLNEYNEIVSNANNSDVDIMSRITDLEFKIEHYENSKGSQKKMQEQTQAILQDIEELDLKNHQLSIEEFSDAFLALKERYNGLEIDDFHEKDIIENKLHELQVILISRLLQERQDIKLESVIKEQNKNGLSIAINGKISRFMQSEDLRIKNKAQKVRNIFMTNNEALYSRKMWQLLYELETGRTRANEANIVDSTLASSNSTALTIAPRRQTLSPFQKFARLFSKEPQLPLQVGDLKKINIDWLANHIPQQMLEEIEIKRLQAEGKSTDKVFIPEARTPIYDMFAFLCVNKGDFIATAEVKEKKYMYDEWPGRKIPVLEKTGFLRYKYVDNNGIEKKFNIEKPKTYNENGRYLGIQKLERPLLKIISADEQFTIQCYDDYRIENRILYAQLIDKILGTNWNGRLLSEIEKFAVSSSSWRLEMDNEKAQKELKIYNNLRSSYFNMKEEYERTRLDFRGSEEARREQFYKRHSLGEQPKEHKNEITTPQPENYIGNIEHTEHSQEDEDIDY